MTSMYARRDDVGEDAGHQLGEDDPVDGLEIVRLRHHGLDAHGRERVAIDGPGHREAGAEHAEPAAPQPLGLGADLVDDVQPRDRRLGLDLVPREVGRVVGADGEVGARLGQHAAPSRA